MRRLWIKLTPNFQQEEIIEHKDAAKKKLLGAILTDTNALAHKFGTSREEVIQTIREYIQDVSDVIDYQLIDAYEALSRNMTMPIFSAFRKKDWREYHKILYSSRSSLFRDTPKYLFIIGGEDVVPMPELIADRKFEIPDKVIPTDYVYAFDVVPPQNALEAIRRR